MPPTVRKFPTKLQVRCPQCQHAGVVEVFLDKPPKLHCSRCGNKNPIIVQRDRTRMGGAPARQKLTAMRIEYCGDALH
jgi:transcription elongation factor Elf1